MIERINVGETVSPNRVGSTRTGFGSTTIELGLGQPELGGSTRAGFGSTRTGFGSTTTELGGSTRTGFGSTRTWWVNQNWV